MHRYWRGDARFGRADIAGDRFFRGAETTAKPGGAACRPDESAR
jgi:hypothetical protein